MDELEKQQEVKVISDGGMVRAWDTFQKALNIVEHGANIGDAFRLTIGERHQVIYQSAKDETFEGARCYGMFRTRK